MVLVIGKNTSNLSKFITHGILTEKEIITQSLEKFKYEVIEKFIQEILWRIYWKGWLEKDQLYGVII